MNVKVIVNKILTHVRNEINNFKWGKLGGKSRVIKPLRIVNKRYIYIEDNVTIYHQSRLEAIREWSSGTKILKYNGEIHLGKGTSIQQRCHIIAADYLSIGSDCVLSADVYISDCAHGLRLDRPIMDQPLNVKRTTIGNDVLIGIGAKIMPGVKLGDHCVIGANAVVTHDIPPKAVVAGVPAKIISYRDCENA